MSCERRGLDAARLSDYFKANGWRIVDQPSEAGCLLLVTCADQKAKVEESFDLIQDLKRFPGELIVAGCLPGIEPGPLSKVFQGKTIVTKELEKIDDFFPHFRVKFKNVPDSNRILKNSYTGSSLRRYIKTFEWSRDYFLRTIISIKKRCFTKPPLFLEQRERMRNAAILRVGHGCLSHCSYCAIRFATGTLISKPLKDCLAEFKNLLDQGCRQFTLNGEDVGAYGLDIGSSLSELLLSLSAAAGELDVAFYIQTMSPQWAVRYKETLCQLVSEGRIKILKIDIQSGSERILKLMQRFSDLPMLAELYSELRRSNPTIKTASHFIVGFPSETEEDLLESVKIMKKLIPDVLEIFAYSDMTETASSVLPDKVSYKVIRKRLETIQKTMAREGYKSHLDVRRLLLSKISARQSVINLSQPF